jgi:hypothetical protein
VRQVDPPVAAAEFLGEWALRDRRTLAHDPIKLVRRMDLPLERVLYVAALDLLDVLASAPLPALSPGELRVTMMAHWGEEARWQLAALLADTVVLQYGRDEPILGYHALSEICGRPEPEGQEVDSSGAVIISRENESKGSANQPPLSTSNEGSKIAGSQLSPDDESPELPLDVVAILEALADEPEFSAPDYTAWMERVLPERLAAILRFLVHLAAVKGPSRVLMTSPDLTGLRATWLSLRGVYYWDGEWGCSDPGDWITPAPPQGAVILKQAIDATGAYMSDIEEIFASYKLGEKTARGHVPLIPSNATVHAAAIEFYSRFRRIFVVSPLVSFGPQAEPVDPGLGPDWRPALADQVLLDAFPGAATIDPSAFEYLHTMRGLADFRHRMRTDAERVSGLNAEESAVRLGQISRELSEAARDASAALAEAMTSGRRNLSLTGAVAGLIAGAGFVSFGTVGAIAGGLVATSLTAAVEQRKLDPAAAMSGTELALVTLDKGKPPRKRRRSRANVSLV